MPEIRENPKENIEAQITPEQAAGEFLDAQRDSNIRKFPTEAERQKLSDQVGKIVTPEAVSPQPADLEEKDPKLIEALVELDQAQGLVNKIAVLNSWMTSNKLEGNSAVKFMDKAMKQVEAIQRPNSEQEKESFRKVA